MKKKRLSLTKIFCSNRPAFLFVCCKEIKKKKSFRQRGAFLEGKAAVEKLRKNKKEKRDTRRQKRARLLSPFSLSLSLSLSLCFVRKRTRDRKL